VYFLLDRIVLKNNLNPRNIANNARPIRRRAFEKAEVFLGLVVGRVSGILGVSRPDALAILGSPAIGFASGGKVLGGGLCGLLGLAVLDFVVFHRCHFLSFLYLNYSTKEACCQASF
jgi:hypothetical protein